MTILVDLEQNTVADLLPDRMAQTLAARPRAHPGVEVLARDTASAQAGGARDGAPADLQVVDRRHMLRNLGGTMRVIVERLARAPALADAMAAAWRIALLRGHKSSEPLVAVLEEAGRTLLWPFVATLRRDIAVVQA